MQAQWWLIIFGVVCIIAAWYVWGTSGPTDVHERAEARKKWYGFNVPWWLASWRSSSSNSRIELIGQIKAETIVDITLESDIKRVEMESSFVPDQVTEARGLQAAEAINVLAQTNAATDHKISPLAWDERQRKTHEIDEAIRLDTAKTDNEINKHDQMKVIDVRVEAQLAQIEASLVVLKELMPYHHWRLLHKQLSDVSLEYHQLLQEPQTAYRDAEIKRVQRMMRTLDKDTREREKKLIQGTAGQIEE